MAKMKSPSLSKKTEETPNSFIAGMASKVFETAIDASKDTDRVIAATPKEGFNLKLHLINDAKDLSTGEKLQAVEEAENKYKQDMAENAKLFQKIGLQKIGKFLLCGVGVLAIIGSPFGQKALRTVVRTLS